MLKSILALIILCTTSVCSASQYDLGNNMYYQTSSIVQLENGDFVVTLEDDNGTLESVVVDTRIRSLRLVQEVKTIDVNKLSPEWQRTLVGSLREWEFDNKL